MHREKLPISALPAWCRLCDVALLDIEVRESPSKGYGLVTTRALTSEEDTHDIPALMLVPHDLILSREAIEEHAKVDQHFRQLLEVAGGKITISSLQAGQKLGVSNSWTEYAKMLPNLVPVPTLWTKEEQLMLSGTSLEPAVNAKMKQLNQEFDSLREATTEISWCHKSWWESETIEVSDWILLDSWWRSRSLELPNTGESMIPCIDMVNHSSKPTAYYEPTPEGQVNLLLRPGCRVEAASEVTISYGSSKSAAEMLFSYGFIDEESTAKSLSLPLENDANDWHWQVKADAFPGRPIVHFSAKNEIVEWEGPFLHFLCLNSEDGLDLRKLQETDGSTQVRIYWQEADVTNDTDTFEALTQNHALKDVFRLRAVVLLQDRVQQQLSRLYGSEEALIALADESELDPERQNNAIQLRQSESVILEGALSTIKEQMDELMESSVVLRFLGSMDNEEESEADKGDTNDEDFS